MNITTTPEKPPQLKTNPAAGQRSRTPEQILNSLFSGMIVVVLTVFMWWLLNIQEDRYMLVSTAGVAERVQSEINSEMADRLNALRRMVHRWQTEPLENKEEWLRDAGYLVQDQGGYAWIVLTNNDGWAEWTVGAPPVPGAKPKPDILTKQGVLETIAHATQTAEETTLIWLDAPDLSAENDVFAIIIPRPHEAMTGGAIVAGLHATAFLDASLADETNPDFFLKITRQTGDELRGHFQNQIPNASRAERFTQFVQAGVAPILWEVSATPTKAKVRREHSSLSTTVLSAGLLIALLLSYAIYQRQIAHQREAMASRLGRVMNESSNEIYYFDAHSLKFININEGAMRNIGYTADETATMHPYDIKPEFTEDSFRELVAPLLKGEKDQLLFKTHHMRKDGTTYPVEVNLQISRDDEHPLFFAVVQDLTERQRAEYERERYMAMINNNRDLIGVIDPSTFKFTFVSKGAVKALGYSEEELLDMTPDDLRPNGLADELKGFGQDILAGKADMFVYDVQYRCKNGNLLDLEVHLLPITDFDGKKALLGIGRDITERKKSQAELERARQELERRARDLLRSNQELQQFAYAASHDLQEPLRMVSSYLQLLEEEYTKKLDEEAHEYIHFAVDGANRMRDLIYDLLAFSQVETQGKPFKSVDCTEVVDTALSDLSSVVNESGVMISYEHLPLVHGDYGQLVQLFTNLINNAIKYRGEKDPKVRIEAAQKDGVWEISIIDNGIGINEKFHRKIFEIFKRLHTSDEYQGTGIGLALCKRIVERHGGTIGVRDNPDGGCIFYFTLNTLEKDQTGEAETTDA